MTFSMQTLRSVVRLTTLAAVAAAITQPASAIDPQRPIYQNAANNGYGQVPGRSIQTRPVQNSRPVQGQPSYADPTFGNGDPTFGDNAANPQTRSWLQPQDQQTPRPYGNNYPGIRQPVNGQAWTPGTLAPQPADPRRELNGGRIYSISRNTPGDANRNLPDAPADNFESLNPAHQANATPARWRLGVMTRDTDTGILIKKVLPGSAALDGGMEVNDRIVAVNGYRVGDVHGVKYDLGQEFNLRADDDGLVKLLVQDNRSGRLVNQMINLEPRLSQVSGSLAWSSRSELPRMSYAEVQLQEIFRPGTAPIVLAEVTVDNLRDNAAPFVLEFDPTEIDPNRQYVVAAHITDGHYTYFEHTQPMPVITGGHKRRVEVAMRPIRNWTGGQQTSEADEFAAFERMWQKYMGRPLRPGELALYRSEIDRGIMDTTEAQIDIFSNAEFYNNRCAADDRNFVENVFRLRTGRKPTDQELSYWLAKLDEAPNMRRPFTRDMVGSLN